MRIMTVLLALGLLAALPASASAQDGRKKHGKKEALLKKFDKDGDGMLNKEERRAAKESMRKDGKGKGKGRGEGKQLRRMIFRRFDTNGDRKLDDAERDALKKFLDSHREGKRHKRGRR